MQITYELSEIATAAARFWEVARDQHVITLNGGLGAGKTTFTRALCAYLNVEDIVSSPTFSLVNEYHFKDENQTGQVIYHSDWYRVRDEEEAIQAGIEDMLQRKDCWCIIEWAERVPELLPQHYLSVDFIQQDDTSRTLVLHIR